MMKKLKFPTAAAALLAALLLCPQAVFADVYNPIDSLIHSVASTISFFFFCGLALFLLAAAVLAVVLLVRHFRKKKENPPKDR